MKKVETELPEEKKLDGDGINLEPTAPLDLRPVVQSGKKALSRCTYWRLGISSC
jgi:hypothetical protein